jgi:myosin-5
MRGSTRQLPCYRACSAACRCWIAFLFVCAYVLFSTTRRAFRSDVQHVVYMQSCIRRRFARRELKALREEARSLFKYQEISYKLENKVVELTQNLQQRSEEKKKVEAQLAELRQQLQQWMNRHEESDTRLKQTLANLQVAEAEAARKEELLQAKLESEKRLEEVTTRLVEKEEVILKLTDEISRQALQIEAQQKTLESTPARTQEDSSVILTLKNEVSNLREQLNRANALNVLTRGSRGDQPPPLSPTFAPTLRTLEPNGGPPGNAASANNRHQRRHSSAGVFGLIPVDSRTSADEMMLDVKRTQANNPRAVSVAFNGEDNYMRFRGVNGLPGIRDYDDPAEEKIRLMVDAKKLDEDVLDGLIRGLKIPMPSLTNPSAVKEILFPANLISLVTNEMWKYGLIAESERFLANVMQSIQAHVMVCR